MTHKILLYGTDARVDEVGARLTVAGFTVGVVRDHTQCVALARQHSPPTRPPPARSSRC